MGPYIFLLIFYIVFSLLELNPFSKWKKGIYIIFLLTPFFILLAFRSISVGADTSAYYNTYLRISLSSSLSEAISKSYMETGFSILEYLFSRLGFSFLSFQVVISLFFCISLFVYTFNHSSNPAFFFFLCLGMQVLFGMMNQTRMWIVACIGLTSLSCLRDKKYFRFILFISLASLIHLSAIIYFFVAIVYCLYKNSKSIVAVLLITASFAILLTGNFFFEQFVEMIDRYSRYADSNYYGINVASVLFFVEYLFVLLLTVKSNRSPIQSVYFNSYENSYEYNTLSLEESLCLVLVSLSLAGLANPFMTRVTGLLLLPVCGLFEKHVANVKNKASRQLFLFGTFVLLTSQLFVILFLRPNWDGVVPYEFYY